MLKRYAFVGNFIFMALCAYLAAGSVNAVVASQLQSLPAPQREVGQSGTRPRASQGEAALDAIERRNLLAAKREDLSPPPPVTAEPATDDGLIPADDQLGECSLGGGLVAIIAAEDPAWSIVIYTPRGKPEPEVFAMLPGKDALEGDATLLDVRPKSIVVKRPDHYELCELGVEGSGRRPGVPIASPTPVPPTVADAGAPDAGDMGRSIRKLDEDNYEVAQAEVDNVLSNLSTVATQARIVPNFKNGKADGFKMFSIRPGSIYSKLGLKNGDVIRQINGYDMDSPDRALEIYQKLRSAGSINVSLERRGQPKTLNVSIK